MEILCYTLSAAILVLTGAIISGGVVLPRRFRRSTRQNLRRRIRSAAIWRR